MRKLFVVLSVVFAGLFANATPSNAQQQFYYIGPEAFFYDANGYICRYLWDPYYGYVQIVDECWTPVFFAETTYYPLWWSRLWYVPYHTRYWRSGYVHRQHPYVTTGRWHSGTTKSYSYQKPGHHPGQGFVPQNHNHPGNRMYQNPGHQQQNVPRGNFVQPNQQNKNFQQNNMQQYRNPGQPHMQQQQHRHVQQQQPQQKQQQQQHEPPPPKKNPPKCDKPPCK